MRGCGVGFRVLGVVWGGEEDGEYGEQFGEVEEGGVLGV